MLNWGFAFIKVKAHMAGRNEFSLVGMVLMAGCSLVTVLLLKEALELPYLSGAGAAQADFGLFMLTLAAGMPVAVVAAILLSTWAIPMRGKYSMQIALKKRPVFLSLGILNVLIAPCILA